MPELPEVHTTVADLQKILPGLKITGVWTNFKKMFRNGGFDNLKKEVAEEKILGVKRRGKNILINLSGNKTVLIHQKMTGHLLYGKWKTKRAVLPGEGEVKWQSAQAGPIKDDPMNRFIHVIFSLSGGKQLALSDMRKFAKILLSPTDKLNSLKDLNLGPDPFDKNFTLGKFSAIVKNSRGPIKKVLMDQTLIAGIGNIYSDEILWVAGVHPSKKAGDLRNGEVEKIYNALKPVLKRAIKARGTSSSDYRDVSGNKGKYQEMLYAYRLTGQKCQRNDGGIITRIKVGGRSAHFCPVHQKL